MAELAVEFLLENNNEDTNRFFFYFFGFSRIVIISYCNLFSYVFILHTVLLAGVEF